MFILSNTLIVLGCSVRLSWVSSYRPEGRYNVFKNIRLNPRIEVLPLVEVHTVCSVNGMNLAQELQQRLNTGHQVHTKEIIFLFLNQNICCVYSKEPSQWDSSFEHPKQMFKLMGKKIFTILRSIFFYLNLCTLCNWTGDLIKRSSGTSQCWIHVPKYDLR